MSDLRIQIQTALASFTQKPLREASLGFFKALGYESQRYLPLSTADQFLKQFDKNNMLTERERDALRPLTSLHFLFQLTDLELSLQRDLLIGSESIDGAHIHSYLFFVAELPTGYYTRTTLANIARAINKPLAMPALILVYHNNTVSLAVLHRRLNKRDASKDVLERVTLIKDIACVDPIRAHLEILNDFSFTKLSADFGASNFVSLHEAWQKRLGSYALSNTFYREIADWYFWVHHQIVDGIVHLPLHCDTEQKKSLFLIRLLTRVIFSWFLVEKHLIPSDLFREHRLKTLLKEFHPLHDPDHPDASPTYYRAILQNLFFGTLNMPPEQRAFRQKKKNGQRYDQNYGITNLWRYESAFCDPAAWVSITRKIPFLNGGLFDCLDDKSGKKEDNFILDGFSDREDFGCHLPNDLFFGPERTVDLSKDYGEETKKTARSKRAKIRGLIEILSRYKFTIEENTPLEEEIALDPELLGKVFENLLASYNEDTRTTARKALGAFYTPREIVSYMVDEALKNYLFIQVPRCKGILTDLFSNNVTFKEIKPDTCDALIAAIGRVKILDPACGSGAFPLGVLHRLVDLLKKLDPNNESWKRDRLAEAHRYRQFLEEADATKDEVDACDVRIVDIERSFDTHFHALDFARKLYLIENSIYGVDIQPIATQIAKLRFFISLVVDQKVDPKAPNLGVRPLPNLETHLVAANTLIPIEKAESDLLTSELDKLRAELATIRHEHFNARTPAIKNKWRGADATKRAEIARLLENNHALPRDSAHKLASWDPYDQNISAPFFDSEWMFGIPIGKMRLERQALPPLHRHLPVCNENGVQGEFMPNALHEIDSGFDIIIGNPPYVLIQDGMRDDQLIQQFRQTYEVVSYKIDLYHLFIECGIKLLTSTGTLAFITPSNFATNIYCKTLREFLFRETQLREFLSFEENIFQASVNNWVFLLSKNSSQNNKIRFYKGKTDSGHLTLELISSREQCNLQQNQGLIVPSNGENSERILEAMQQGKKPLGDIATVNFGMQLRNRALFPEDVIDEKFNNKYLTRYHRRCVTGRDIHRFAIIYGGLYCNFNREAKRGGCWDENVHSAKNKILIRQIGKFPEGGLDQEGYAVLNTAFMILPQMEDNTSNISCWLLACINSPCIRFFWTNRFKDDRQLFPKIKGEYLKHIPVAQASEHEIKYIAALITILITLAHHSFDSHISSARDPLMLAYWEQVLNGLVYELYFPEEINEAGLYLFNIMETIQLPDVNALPESDRLPRLRQKFEELYDGTHPLRIALNKLQTLDTVRTIEGKK